jgi:hypothetical protein
MSGRKKIVIDWKKVNFYLQAGCNGAAIARLLGLHPDTLYFRIKKEYNMDFSAYMTTKREEGVALMEGTIYKDAIERGGVDRMFWLKNRAGWKDKSEIEHSGSVNIFQELMQKASIAEDGKSSDK